MIASLRVKELHRDAQALAGEKVRVAGWVRTVRQSSSNLAFMELNDGSNFTGVQAVLSRGDMSGFDEAASLNVGSAVIVEGVLALTPGAAQPFEIKALTVEVEGTSSPEYPLQKKRHTLEYLRTIAHLRPRANTFQAVFRVRSLLAEAIHKFFFEQDFVYVHTPLITALDAEGAGEMFQATTLDIANPPRMPDGSVNYDEDFFRRQAYLTVSGQLAVEPYCMAFRNVYTFGPTFRAENSNTARHAAEFWMIEPEIAFADLEDDMNLAEAMMKYIIGYILEKAPQEMAFFNQFIDKGVLERLENVVNSEFARITYAEAMEILAKADAKFEYPVGWEYGIQTEHEKYLSEVTFKRPVFVTNYPKELKAFYMRLDDDERTVAATDLMVPGIGELIGASQREERYDVLVRRIEECGLNPEHYWWYLDLRRFGTARHAGFGLGFDRALMYITGMKNIRDVQPFPRTTGSIEF